jgi:hypothetical protein
MSHFSTQILEEHHTSFLRQKKPTKRLCMVAWWRLRADNDGAMPLLGATDERMMRNLNDMLFSVGC